ncbi:HD domain-containing protein [Marinomonas piezotolerans]|nr:HD domain-containing protein [Marinomonas piezotolerans]
MSVRNRNSIEFIERECEAFAQSKMAQDGAHDLAHLQRVVAMAKRLANIERANPFVIVPAAWLHDIVNLPKNHAERHLASHYSATEADAFLSELGYDDRDREAVKHAIVAHSFSANVSPKTLEAQVVQDADRLDALGAIGVSRCLMVGGQLERFLYEVDDPFGNERPLQDDVYTLDHFYQKLLCLEGTFHTRAGQQEATRRTQFMRAFLNQLASEIDP